MLPPPLIRASAASLLWLQLILFGPALLLNLFRNLNELHMDLGRERPASDVSHLAAEATTTLAEERANSSIQKTNATITDPCSVDFWLAALAAASSSAQKGLNELLLPNNLQAQDLEMLHMTFSVKGATNKAANDFKRQRQRRRDVESFYSSRCLRNTLPDIWHRTVELGDYASYQSGLVGMHQWLARAAAAASGMNDDDSSTKRASFVLDTDVFANPRSLLNSTFLLQALRNVDLVVAYHPLRNLDPHNPQTKGVQSGLMGQRHNLRTHLLHQCVAHVLQSHLLKKNRNKPRRATGNTTASTNEKPTKSGLAPMRQQQAMNWVLLESDVGQFLRVKWLPPEFHCWFPHLQAVDDFVVHPEPQQRHNDSCFFLHSHQLSERRSGQQLEVLCA